MGAVGLAGCCGVDGTGLFPLPTRRVASAWALDLSEPHLQNGVPTGARTAPLSSPVRLQMSSWARGGAVDVREGAGDYIR